MRQQIPAMAVVFGILTGCGGVGAPNPEGSVNDTQSGPSDAVAAGTEESAAEPTAAESPSAEPRMSDDEERSAAVRSYTYGSRPDEAPPDTAEARDAAEPRPNISVASDSNLVGSVKRPGATTERHGYSPERVFFATNREAESSPGRATDPDIFFGDDRGDVTWGICEVSIPYRREPGTLPEPSILRLEFSQDPAKHVVLMEIDLLPQADFWRQLRAQVEQSLEHKLLVFIHGYCATFRDAARRTAQIAYDINYKGPAMFFSWPAGSDTEQFGERENYLKDLRRAEQSDEDLITVLSGISRYSGAEKIHLVAHSMGNFVLTEALKTMDDRRPRDEPPAVLFDQVALAAPDIDAREFVQRTATRLKPFSHRFTVYASSADKALWLSKQVNGFEPLGFLNRFTQEGAQQEMFDLIDASQLTSGWFDSGHIYYGDMPEMLKDLGMLFRGLGITSLQRGLAETPPLYRLLPNP